MSVTSAILSANPRLLFFLAFVSILSLLLYRDRGKVQRVSILFYRRTKHGIEYIDAIAQAAPRFWNIYGWTGVVFAVLTIPFILYNVLVSFSNMISGGGSGGGPSLVAPGLSGETTFQSGISFIPVEYWIISVGILMFFHEMSHGIVARAEGMEINSVGWIVLGIIPGAFVEPKGENMLPEEGEDLDDVEEEDEESSGGMWDQGSLGSQLKVLAAGSFANYLVAIVFAAFALLMFVNIAHPEGVFYVAQDDFPAKQAGMSNGTIYSVNGERVRYAQDVTAMAENFTANDTVTLNTSEGAFNVTLTERNGSAYMGVLMGPGKGLRSSFYDMINNRRVIKPDFREYSGILSWTLSGLQVVALLNLLIGMFNMLPAKPLDGGQMVAAVLEEYYPDGDRSLNYWSLLVWAALLTAIIYSIAAPLI
jgi:hypothetical protein